GLTSNMSWYSTPPDHQTRPPYEKIAWSLPKGYQSEGAAISNAKSSAPTSATDEPLRWLRRGLTEAFGAFGTADDYGGDDHVRPRWLCTKKKRPADLNRQGVLVAFCCYASVSQIGVAGVAVVTRLASVASARGVEDL